MNIVFLASTVYPFGAAYSGRIINFTNILVELGCEVHIIADYTLEEEFKSEKVHQYGNATFEIANPNRISKWNRGLIIYKSIKILKKHLDNNHVDVVLSNACSDRFFLIQRIIKRKKIPLVLEICECRDITNFKYGLVNPFYYLDKYALKYCYKRCDFIIAISSLLEDRYKQYVNKVLRIPTILDTCNTPFQSSKINNKLKIMYAGNPGKSKELLYSILLAIKKLISKNKRLENVFVFNVYGIDRKAVLDNIKNDFSLLDEVKKVVNINGKIKQQNMVDIYREHDYSIFIRPNRLSSNAGFPTKLAESLAAGTPVITNRTGDIDKYLVHLYNGYIVNDDMENIYDLFQNLLSINKLEYEIMRDNARSTAVQNFDYKIYVEKIKELLDVNTKESIE